MGKHTATLMMMPVQLKVLIILVFFAFKTPAEFEDLYAERAAAEGYNLYSRYGLSMLSHVYRIMTPAAVKMFLDHLFLWKILSITIAKWDVC